VSSYALLDEFPAGTPTATSRAKPVASRKMKTRIAALMCAGAAAFTLSACGASGSGAGSRAVAIASQQAGEPYVFGAAGPDSFDCSGFTQYVYGQMGISLPRTATEQGNAATLVPQSSAAPGDLIFFGTPGNFYHVGIYAGGGQIWYAPKTGDVVKEAPIWDSGYYVGKV
jgi:cell wall-associated NlpC family hydrolase